MMLASAIGTNWPGSRLGASAESSPVATAITVMTARLAASAMGPARRRPWIVTV